MKDEITIEVTEDSAIAAFNGKVSLDDILTHIEKEAKSIVQDAETITGRKEIAAVAYKVSRSKTLIDGVGKSLVAGWKEQAKTVDAKRKHARDFLDNLRDEVRKPVTEWEEEQKRKQEEEIRKEEEAQAARLAEIERREAELLAKEQAAKEKEEAERRAKEQADREKRIAKEAAERAKREAEEKTAREKEEQERIAREAIEAKERAEREAKEAVELAKFREEEARKKAEQDKIAAVEQEKARALAEKKRKEEEAKTRAADIEHKKKINNAACSGLSVIVDVKIAQQIVIAIAKGQIPHCKD